MTIDERLNSIVLQAKAIKEGVELYQDCKARYGKFTILKQATPEAIRHRVISLKYDLTALVDQLANERWN